MFDNAKHRSFEALEIEKPVVQIGQNVRLHPWNILPIQHAKDNQQDWPVMTCKPNCIFVTYDTRGFQSKMNQPALCTDNPSSFKQKTSSNDKHVSTLLYT